MNTCLGKIVLAGLIFIVCTCTSSKSFAQNELKSAFTFTETDRDNKSYSVHNVVPMTAVDRESVIDIGINKELLPLPEKEVFGNFTLEDISEQRSALEGVLKSIDDYVTSLIRSMADLHSQAFDEGGVVKDEDKAGKYSSISKKAASTARATYRSIFYYIAKKEKIELSPDEKSMQPEELFSLLTSRFPDFCIKYKFICDIKSIKDPAIKEFVESELNALKQQNVERITGIMNARSKVQLRLTASLYHEGKLSAYLHLPNYDKNEPMNPNPVDRMSFVLDDASKEQLRQEVKFYDDLSSTINEIRAKYPDLRNALFETAAAFKKDVRQLAEKQAAITEAGEQLAQKLIDFLKDAETWVKSKKTIRDIKDIKSELREIKEAHQNVKETIAKIRNVTTNNAGAEPILVDFVQGKVVEIINLANQIKDYLDTLQQDSENGKFSDIRTKLESIMKDPDIKAKLSQERKKSLDELESKLLSETEAAVLANKNKFATLIVEFQKLWGELNAASGLANAVKPNKPIDRFVNDVVNSRITVAETNGKDGDMIKLNMTLLTNDSEKKTETIHQEDSIYFQLKTFGWHSQVSPSIVFVRSEDVKFVAAPAVAYSYRYTYRDYPFWDIVTPAIGLHTAALHFNQSGGTEIGVGLTLSWLGDILQVGAGYNLHAEKNNKYWFIGIGLLDLLDRNSHSTVP